MGVPVVGSAHTQQTQFLRYKDHITQERWETASTSDQNKNPYLYDGNLTQELSLFMQGGGGHDFYN